MTKFKFAEGERVLCFHGPLIYEAKALKSSVSKDQIKYYIHYAGWNKNWDEWVPENRVLKYNEANVQRQKEVFKQHSATSKQAGKKGGTKAKKSGDTSIGESRAMTPSKDVSGTTTSTSSSATATTPITATTTTSSSRSSRGSKQAAAAAAARPTTPSSKEIENANKKEDSVAKEEAANTSIATAATPAKDAKDDKDDKESQLNKKKRGSSHTSDKSATTNTSTTPTPPSSSTGTTTTTGGVLTATTSHHDGSVESEETFLNKIEVKIKIPEELKQCLTDDWDSITRQRKLLDIPAKVCVQDIVDQYIAFKKAARSTNATKEVAITDVAEGIVEYFNVMVGPQLLYKYERPQFVETLSKHPDKTPSQLYGSFHLLRLFVKLGTMLGYSALDEKSIQMLLVHINDFLKFLVKNSATFFSMSYFVNVDSAHFRQTQQ